MLPSALLPGFCYRAVLIPGSVVPGRGAWVASAPPATAYARGSAAAKMARAD